MSYLPAELKENLNSLSQSLDTVESSLAPIFEFSSLSALNSQLSVKDSSKLNIALAYAVNSLYCILLKTQGKDISSHPIKQEIERIKESVSKIQDALSNKPQTLIPTGCQTPGKFLNKIS